MALARQSLWAMLCVVAAGISVLPAAKAEQQEPDDLKAFSASYELKRSGFKARRIVELRMQEKGRQYSYTSTSKARGAAAAFKSGTVTELSRFTINDGRLYPLEYRLSDENDADEGQVRLRYDWRAGLIRVAAKGEQSERAIEADLLTPLLVDIALMRDLRRGAPETSYRVLEGTQVRSWQFRKQGEQELRTVVGKLSTHRYELDRQSSRTLVLWLAPVLGYLPVRLEQRKDDELKLEMTLRSVAGFGSPESLRRPIYDRR